MKAKPLPPLEELREAFAYDPGSGVITRLSGRYKGKVAGYQQNQGYISISHGSQPYLAHRIAYKLMTGEEPGELLEIDHRNHNKSDNRWENLRLGTKGQNARNTPSYRNIYYEERPGREPRWVAQLRVEGKTHRRYRKTQQEALQVAQELRDLFAPGDRVE